MSKAKAVAERLRKVYQELVEEGYHYPNELLGEIDECIMELGGKSEHDREQQ